MLDHLLALKINGFFFLENFNVKWCWNRNGIMLLTIYGMTSIIGLVVASYTRTIIWSLSIFTYLITGSFYFTFIKICSKIEIVFKWYVIILGINWKFNFRANNWGRSQVSDLLLSSLLADFFALGFNQGLSHSFLQRVL